MKVYIQIVDKMTGIYQCGMIEEPVIEGKEIENALGHFGVTFSSVVWLDKITTTEMNKTSIHQFGKIDGTSKIISVILVNFIMLAEILYL